MNTSRSDQPSRIIRCMIQIQMRVTIVEILLYVYFTCVSANVPSTKFSLKLREVKRIDVILKSFVQPIVIVLNTTANIALYGSFCESKQGKAIYLGDGSITKQLSSRSLYEFAQTTKCDNDVDPFYENISGTSRRFASSIILRPMSQMFTVCHLLFTR